MPIVMAMTITVNSLLLRLKLDCDGGYDVAMKGLSVVVIFGSYGYTQLPKKGIPFLWTTTTQVAFEVLKRAL